MIVGYDNYHFCTARVMYQLEQEEAIEADQDRNLSSSFGELITEEDDDEFFDEAVLAHEREDPSKDSNMYLDDES